MPRSNNARPVAKPVASKPPPVRPFLADRVHAALVKAGRPVTRGELNFLYLDGSNKCKTPHVVAALDALIAEGLATRDEERGRGTQAWRKFEVYRATDEGQR